MTLVKKTFLLEGVRRYTGKTATVQVVCKPDFVILLLSIFSIFEKAGFNMAHMGGK
jgi:hypothetical protein